MDVRYFLNQRLSFARQLYANSAEPFLERKQKIKTEEEPYVPKHGENDEPPFFGEWLEAENSLRVLGHVCVSILVASFHLYLKTLERQTGVRANEKYKAAFKDGWFAGYRTYFRGEFCVEFEKSRCNLDLLEELVLARNRFEHPESITSPGVTYSEHDLKKLGNPLFIDDRDLELFSDLEDGERTFLLLPEISITQMKFLDAVSEVERFAEWLESQLNQPSPPCASSS